MFDELRHHRKWNLSWKSYSCSYLAPPCSVGPWSTTTVCWDDPARAVPVGTPWPFIYFAAMVALFIGWRMVTGGMILGLWVDNVSLWASTLNDWMNRLTLWHRAFSSWRGILRVKSSSVHLTRANSQMMMRVRRRVAATAGSSIPRTPSPATYRRLECTKYFYRSLRGWYVTYHVDSMGTGQMMMPARQVTSQATWGSS